LATRGSGITEHDVLPCHVIEDAPSTLDADAAHGIDPDKTGFTLCGLRRPANDVQCCTWHGESVCDRCSRPICPACGVVAQALRVIGRY